VAFLAPLIALAAGAAAPPQPDRTAEDRVRAHVEFLADDLLEGRATGERGHAIAAAYVAGQFRALGLRPGGENGGWYQQVPFRRATHAKAPVIRLLEGGRSTALAQGAEIAVAPSLTQKQRRIDTALVFVGYGLSDKRLGLDDYAGLDVRGKTVVAFTGMPSGITGEIAAHLTSTKVDMAAARGAIGFIDVGVQAGQGSRPDRIARFTRSPVVDWVDRQGRAGSTPPGMQFTAAISATLADRLFNAAPRSLAKVRAEARRPDARPRGFALAPRLLIDATADWQDFTSPEVIGVLPGSDPRLAHEHVAMMGHLDHLGLKKDARPGEDSVYNGALDNAAGVATLIEAARHFVTAGRRPRRSVLFLAHTGEEIGLLGSDYYAAHPTVPIDRIVAGVDLDMPVPLYDFTDVVAFGADHSTVVRNVESAARSMGMTVSPDPMPEQSIFVRSDHYRFVVRGVPAILLFTGYANGGKAKWDHYFANTYHTVRDDLSQPINWRAAARYAELNYRIAGALADADQRPLWYRGDYFGDTFAPGRPRAER
jgi:hypothetical protein